VTLRSELGRGTTFTVRLPMQLSEEPRLEFDLSDERIDLSKAQRVDVRLYAGMSTPATKLDTSDTQVQKRGSTDGAVGQVDAVGPSTAPPGG
jgi:hypothetical protein